MMAWGQFFGTVLQVVIAVITMCSLALFISAVAKVVYDKLTGRGDDD